MKAGKNKNEVSDDFDPVAILETLRRFDVRFESEELLKRVFVHDSFLGDTHDLRIRSNEELEFLGDSVLSLVVSHYLYKRGVPTEGKLTKLRASLVKNRRLADAARVLKLGDSLLLSRGEAENGGRGKTRILSGCFEAIVGALYLDQGYGQASKLVHAVLLDDDKQTAEENLDMDSKSDLNEYCQRRLKAIPEYKVLSQAGPDHVKVFEVAVYLGKRELGRGQGMSKHQAEREAAKDALKHLSGERA